MERGEQPYAGNERELLEQWLAFQRATLSAKCSGLTGEELQRHAAPPSTLSLARLLRHLADMENIDAAILEGRPVQSLYEGAGTGTDDESAVDSGDGEGGMYDWSLYDVDDDAVSVWLAQCARLDAAVSAFASLDDRAPGDFSVLSARSVLLALVMEYARHNGHADLLRENLDGHVGY